MRTALRGPLTDASDAVRHPTCPGHAGAVGAAVEMTVGLYAVADDLNAAVFADGCKGVYGALEAIERVRGAIGHSHLKALVILISAYLTLGHLHHPSRFGVLLSTVTTLASVWTNADPQISSAA